MNKAVISEATKKGYLLSTHIFKRNSMRIYLTHCSAKKDDSLRDSSEKVTPDKLYTARFLVRFVKRCEEKQVDWAILSDEYGIWFPYEKHEWYNKNPNTVSDQEFKRLVENFEEKLGNYDEIYFYHNPGRFHPLYKRLLEVVKVNGKIVLFSHLNEIS